MTIAKLESRLKNYSFFNLAKNYQLNNLEITILGSGVKFIPSPTPLKQFDYFKYVYKLIRNTRLSFQFNFLDLNSAASSEFRIPNPQFQPDLAPNDIEKLFTKLLDTFKDINIWLDSFTHKFKSNVNNAFRKSLKKLILNDKIIIMPADKNLGLTIMDTELYINECIKILNSTNFIQLDQYAAISNMKMIIKLFDDALFSYKGTHKNFCHLLLKHKNIKKNNNNYYFNYFYALPKMHKVNLSFRPIIAGHNYLFQPLSKYIAKLFNNFISIQPFYLKNSTALIIPLENIQFNNLDQVFIICGDVESLYPSIPINECMNAVQYYIQDIIKFASFKSILSINDILYLINLYLKSNLIEFNGKFFKQINGIAMGNSSSVQLANLYMFYIEKELSLPHYIKLIKRYIDDILIVWEGPYSLLLSFLNQYNSLRPNIKINFNISNKFQSNTFLDLNLQISHHNNRITLCTHQKSLNKYLYIPFNSYHSLHQKKGFIIGELMRYIRNSSTLNAFLLTRNLFYTRLLNRGYSTQFLNPIFKSIIYSHQYRTQLLLPSTTPPPPAQPEIRPFILAIPHNPAITHDVWELLFNQLMHKGNLTPNELLFLEKFMVVRYKNPSIGDIFSKARKKLFKTSTLP